jgi:hypothetical protein
MPTYRCRKTRKAPAVDGTIDPKVWRLAQAAQLALNDSGKPPLQPTEARMLYDDDFLYAAFHCVDSDAWGALPNRNDPLYLEEVVEVFLDPSGRRRCYVEIEVSPLNVIFEAYILNDPRCPPLQGLTQWTCRGLRTAVHVERETTPRGRASRYWNCEMAIPFNQLPDAPHVPPKPGDRWRANLYRIDRAPRLDEHSAWSPTGVLNFHMPEKFGDLLFLTAGER